MRFHGVSFRYARRARWTLHDVHAVVEPGSTVVVLGRNGAGKSTLLQLAAGVLRPAHGTISDRPQVVGWVPERFPADQPFTAGDYLRRMAEVRGLSGPSVADAWIERLLLAEHAGTRLADLSKGTAQKVGLAQALLAPPGLLVLDEPWEGLDAAARTLIPEIVGEVTAAGGAVLVSDHRGEIATLPGAIHWTVDEGTVRTSHPSEYTGVEPRDSKAHYAGVEPRDSKAHYAGVEPRDSEVHHAGVESRDNAAHHAGVESRDNAAHHAAGDPQGGAAHHAGGGPLAGGADHAGGGPRNGEPNRAGDGEPEDGEVVVEVAVARSGADRAVAQLRAAGHRVLSVRPIEAGRVREERS